MQIVEVNHGVANRFKDEIEINKHLKDYPQLLERILEHEEAHTNKVVSMQDFKLDFLLPTSIYYKQLFRFMLKHPKSFTQLLPLYYTRKRGLIYDINMILMYLIMIVVFSITLYLGGIYL